MNVFTDLQRMGLITIINPTPKTITKRDREREREREREMSYFCYEREVVLDC